MFALLPLADILGKFWRYASAAEGAAGFTSARAQSPMLGWG